MHIHDCTCHFLLAKASNPPFPFSLPPSLSLSLSSPLSSPLSSHRCLLEQMDMKDKPIDEALREFQILFRMPVSGRRGKAKEEDRALIQETAPMPVLTLMDY